MSDSLHPIERKILSALPRGTSLTFEGILTRTGLQADQVRRALQWLASKGLVELSESVETKLEVLRRPPELVLMEALENAGNPQSVASVRATFESQEEFSAALGRARASGWIVIDKENQTVAPSDRNGPRALSSLIQRMQAGSVGAGGADAGSAADLLKRGIVRKTERKTTSVTLTALGTRAETSGASEETIDRLTPEVLYSGSWRGKRLRPIDVEAKAPVFSPGRRHPVRDFIREVREAYVSMGFTELRGDSVHPAFWNFDALFIPQDHPGREMQDTFYLEGVADDNLPRSGIVADVASTHEDGWKTGSKGWGYKWRIEEARRLVLRTHNTVLTIRALSESKNSETRVFAVSKVYRNESLDYKHLAEFHQMDGIMVGAGLNIRHLMGFLGEFYRKLGMTGVKLWPTFFPYTEPSLEVVGYSELVKDWIELGGAGVFRPEVTLPLGVKVPVLAWGPGIERLMLMRFGLDDMRELYGNDLSWLRTRRDLAGR